jgi:phosphoglycerol transferase MdoB-like AlkP superfamily enzyme
MAWGVNGWQNAPKQWWPKGSYVKDKLLYTPMQRDGDHFAAKLYVPKNTLLDYVFWISKGFRGAQADVWDVNVLPEKDYHTLALVRSAVMIDATVRPFPKEMLSVFDLALPIFVFCLICFCIFFSIKRRLGFSLVTTGVMNRILSFSLVLFGFLIFIRPTITGAAWELYLDPLHNLGSLLGPSFSDFIFIVSFGAFFLLVTFAFKKFPRVQKGMTIAHATFCLIFLIVGLLNIRVVQSLGKPFTYQWLYYSDFLNSTDAKVAVTANMNLEYIIRLLLLVGSAILVSFTFIGINQLLWRTRTSRSIALVSITVICLIFGLYTGRSSMQKNWDVNKTSNPVIAFLGSVNPLSSSPELFTMNVADSLQYHSIKKRSVRLPGSEKIKNVILFVLESTAAEYMSVYGSKYQVTPELAKYSKNALLFKNIYAHAPATNNSMVSLLGSIYPMISYATLTQKHPHVAIPTLSSELKNLGYNTAFFNSADNRFQRAGEFLERRKFDHIRDCRDNTHFTVNYKDAKFLDGSDDQTTVEDMLAWINQNKNDPFFTMMWTYQTHYPYFVSDQEISYETSDPVLNRYLNAVHHSDKVFGQLMQYLQASGLDESTLVVLVGDHGEAFGRHDQTTHASHIYEENLHVPCVFINPAFTYTEYTGLGGLVDIAPTIFSLLDKPAPSMWHGKDLFTASEADRVYFFASWSDYLFGYREGKHKYIFNATRNFTEVYDLEADPLEAHNIVDQVQLPIEVTHQRMAGWVQAVNRFIDERAKVK